MKLEGLPIFFWINLDRCIRRKNYMTKLFLNYNLKNIRIEAYDGSFDNEKFSNECIFPSNKKKDKKEFACTFSNLKAIKKFYYETDLNECIICEDDLSFEYLPHVLFDWIEFYNNLPKNYNIIQLAIYFNPKEKIVGFDKLCLKKNKQIRCCAAAYLITKNAAKILLDRHYNKEKNIFNLNTVSCFCCENVIYNIENVYSIPLFTYLTIDSEIHPEHLNKQNKSKMLLLNLWKNNKTNFNKITYFSNFPK